VPYTISEDLLVTSKLEQLELENQTVSFASRELDEEEKRRRKKTII
jgi:hypothetical protein